jgi:hypothetical protein
MSGYARGLSDPVGTFAMVAEFDSPDELLSAAEKARFEGYSKMDAYSPFPIHGLSDAIGFRDSKVPFMVFIGGLCGATFGFTLLWYTASIDYPLNVGGKPFNSLPSFVPITFECTVLWSALTAVFGMLALNKLPKPYHPIFNTPGFQRASQDRFFLSIEATDPKFDSDETKKFMATLHPISVNEVEHS